MTSEGWDGRKVPAREGRTFVLCAGFIGGVIGGYWVGLVVAFASGLSSADPPRFPNEDLVAALLASSLIGLLIAFVHRADGSGRQAALGLLFAASFATLNVLCALYLLAPPETLCILPLPGEGTSARSGVIVSHGKELPPQCRPTPPRATSSLFTVAMAPMALVAVLLCSATVRRSALLQLAGLGVGSFCALAGLLLSVARALA